MRKLAAIFLAGFLSACAAAPEALAQQKGRIYGQKHLPTPSPRFYSPADLTTYQVGGTFGITNFLITQFPVAKYGELRQVSAVKSAIGTHYIFKQFYKNKVLYKTELKLNVSHAGEILSVAASLHELPKKASARTIKARHKIAEKHLQKLLGLNAGKAKHTIEETLFLEKGELYSGILLTYGSPNTTLGSKEILLDAKGHVRDEYDLITNYKGKHTHGNVAHARPAKELSQVRDTAVTALVLHPATKPSWKKAPAITHPAKSMALLNGGQQKVAFLAGIRNDTFLLQSPYAVIKEFDPPMRPVAYSLSPDFHFQLGQNGFEQVNVLYHITAWQQYLQQLGFTNLANQQLEVDANGWNGLDQSSYSAFTNTLSFGVGGVEDGQDPQVIIHEYSHAISRSACSTPAVGYERKMLEEANADYFAVSYKKATDPTDWQRIFTWDGHNEFWPGRMAVTEKRYPIDVRGDIYADAVIWTATLMQIQEQLGRQITDKLVLQSMYSYSSYLTLPEAARLLLQADEQLFSGEHRTAITRAFVTRGILPKSALALTGQPKLTSEPKLPAEITFSETATLSPTPALPLSETHLPIHTPTPTPVFSAPAQVGPTSLTCQTHPWAALLEPEILNRTAPPGSVYLQHPKPPGRTTALLFFW